MNKTETPDKSKSSTIEITLKKSAISRPSDQKATLIGLGLKRLQQTVIRKDTLAIRGMLKKVSHLIEVRYI